MPCFLPLLRFFAGIREGCQGAFDNEGNITKAVHISDGLTWTFNYDNLNHLTGAQQRQTDGGTLLIQTTYIYDVHANLIGRDVWTQVGGTTTTARYALDGNQVWADLDSSNSLQTRYLRGDAVDELFARTSAAGAVGWYLADHLGSVRDVMGNTGTVLDHIDYDPFGNITNETNAGSGDRYKYALLQWDTQLGLYWAGRRFFYAADGRWMSQDPLGFAAGDANLYRYVGNGPTNARDPSGLLTTDENLGSKAPGSSSANSYKSYDEYQKAFQAWTNDLSKILGLGKNGVLPASGTAQAKLLSDWLAKHPMPTYEYVRSFKDELNSAASSLWNHTGGLAYDVYQNPVQWQGFKQLALGVLQTVTGAAALVLAPEPSTKVVAGIAGVNGIDNWKVGWNQLSTATPSPSFIKGVISNGAKQVGASEEAADKIGNFGKEALDIISMGLGKNGLGKKQPGLVDPPPPPEPTEICPGGAPKPPNGGYFPNKPKPGDLYPRQWIRWTPEGPDGGRLPKIDGPKPPKEGGPIVPRPPNPPGSPYPPPFSPN